MNHDSDPPTDGQSNGMFGMMAMMMACCMGLFLVIALVPVIGWPAGIALFIVAAAGMLLWHTKFMRHGPRTPGAN